MLSAGHCGDNGQIAKDGGGDVMGTIVNKHSAGDTLLINTPSAARMYVGPWDSTTSVQVSAAKSSQVGNYVCSSGAFTGSHCPHKVEAVNLTIVVSGGFWKPMVRAKNITNKVAVGMGDSGGTISTWTVFPTSSVAVLGTMSAGSGPLGPCGLSPKCFSTVYYASISDTMKYYASVNLPITVLTVQPPA
jgi:hypothetical protein